MQMHAKCNRLSVKPFIATALLFLLTVAFDENGNILLVEEGSKTYFFDPQGNYIGVIKDFGAPKKIIFKDGKVIFCRNS